jgi:hypothetical protein
MGRRTTQRCGSYEWVAGVSQFESVCAILHVDVRHRNRNRCTTSSRSKGCFDVVFLESGGIMIPQRSDIPLFWVCVIGWLLGAILVSGAVVTEVGVLLRLWESGIVRSEILLTAGNLLAFGSLGLIGICEVDNE